MNTKIHPLVSTLAIGLAVLLFVLAILLFARNANAPTNDASHLPKQTQPQPDTKACPMLARECPDGSYVGPTGPNCEFKCPGE